MTNLINLITLSRIFLAVIILILLASNNGYKYALMLFFIAGISDYLDGYLARRYQSESVIGEILDPIADKVLIVFLFFGLSVTLSSYIIAICASLIISREIWVSALRDFNSRNSNTSATKVTYLGKVKTSIQLLTIALYLVALAFNKMILIVVGDIFLVVSVLITLYSGYEYTLNSFRKKI